jgi:hypothetical protein
VILQHDNAGNAKNFRLNHDFSGCRGFGAGFGSAFTHPIDFIAALLDNDRTAIGASSKLLGEYVDARAGKKFLGRVKIKLP